MYFLVAPTTEGYSWWLVDDEGAITCEAGMFYSREPDAFIAARFFQRRAPSTSFTAYETADRRFRWIATRRRHIVAISHSSFDTSEAAELAARVVRYGAPSALGL